ncbi:AraC family transcriptional regulator [Vibrio mytili]|uniref:AraC family transcriptional regulator n=1 Tax=Vibrio mytili TaxID=50718 RepID=A0A0C3I5H1_9VIBR|nr:AraC family transcriptional regulator [Vibrio mytili]KIN10285.1 AraC family transcriptional regulator [Vibrio mytili]
MENQTKAYWIGESFQSLPEPYYSEFYNNFELHDYSNDISILSSKECEYFFYYLTHDHNELLKGIVTLCENLDKRLIVVYPHNDTNTEPNAPAELYESLPPEHVTAEYYSLNQSTINNWLSQIKLKYFLSNGINSGEISIETGEKDISQVIHYIMNNIDKDVREEDAAALCHYSPTYFSRVFHKKVGMCFRDYITTKRISLAKQMLTEDDSTKIAYIAYQCGYHDVSYFSRIFKKKTGLSPASYRQQF